MGCVQLLYFGKIILWSLTEWLMLEREVARELSWWRSAQANLLRIPWRAVKPAWDLGQKIPHWPHQLIGLDESAAVSGPPFKEPPYPSLAIIAVVCAIVPSLPCTSLGGLCLKGPSLYIGELSFSPLTSDLVVWCPLAEGMWAEALGDGICLAIISAFRNKTSIFTSWAVLTEYHKLHGVNSRNVFVSQFWGLEAWARGVNKVGFFLGLWGRICSMAPSSFWSFSVNLWHFSVCGLSYKNCPKLCLHLHMIFSLCECLSLCPTVSLLWAHWSYWIKTCLNDLIWTWWTAKIQFPNKVTFASNEVLGCQHF